MTVAAAIETAGETRIETGSFAPATALAEHQSNY
jgi:hypothetical protein